MCLCLPASAPLEHVTLQLKWLHQFQFAGYYVAQEQGFYREAGLDVEAVEATAGTDLVREVVSGRAQYGVSNSSMLLARQADCIRGVIRLSDSLTRWGGEEFIVLMPDTGEAQPQRHLYLGSDDLDGLLMEDGHQRILGVHEDREAEGSLARMDGFLDLLALHPDRLA